MDAQVEKPKQISLRELVSTPEALFAEVDARLSKAHQLDPDPSLANEQYFARYHDEVVSIADELAKNALASRVAVPANVSRRVLDEFNHLVNAENVPFEQYHFGPRSEASLLLFYAYGDLTAKPGFDAQQSELSKIHAAAQLLKAAVAASSTKSAPAERSPLLDAEINSPS
jgi:hypothetical protein